MHFKLKLGVKVNFVKRYISVSSCTAAFIVCAALFLAGCAANPSDFPPLPEQLREFQDAGPLQPRLDFNRIVKAKIPTGPYRLTEGDLLELQIPSVLQTAAAPSSDSPEPTKPYFCRVYDDGTITVPLIGQIQAAGRTLAEVEVAITDAYYPKYCVSRPSIVARVAEYRTAKVSIIGAVENPGVYELRTDQMSLVSLIMAAGGIIDEGAAAINITTTVQQQANDTDAAVEDYTVTLPVKGLNIPFADVAVKEGDTVVVERLEQPVFSVVGLVNKPGNFPYPPDARYNLMQALAFAGGFNLVADPRYTTVHRQKPDGTTVSITFEMVNDSRLTDASTIMIKPGDIVSVEHTDQTRTNLFLDRVFRINTGFYSTLRVID
ncbi:MAG: SLBB domain-containing protein [Planctomycetota bacterium]|nr:MAG: SLBB domain-containing protein [Planctomycetota bacterium]